MLLSIRRIEPHEKLFAFQLKDQKEYILDDPTYYIHVHSAITGEPNDNLAIAIRPMESQKLITVSYDATHCYMEYIIELDKNADAYTYQAERVIGDQCDLTNTAYVESAPSVVENVILSEDETVYDEITSIPTHIVLSWSDYDVVENNPLVQGLEIYYSISLKGKDDWSQYQKLRGLSTDDTVSDITRVPVSQSGIMLEVPQLMDALRPKDIRFSVVAVSDSLQSRLSNVVSIATRNMSATSYLRKIGFATIENGSKEDTKEQVEMSRLVNPYYTISFAGSFENDTFIWCERAYSDDSRYDQLSLHMRLAATTKMLGVYDAEFYLPMPTSYTYKVIGKANEPIPFEYDVKTNILKFSYNKLSELTIILTNTEKRPGAEEYKETFKESTRKLIKRLPTWFKVRRNPVGSVGAYFLEVIGMELEEIEKILNYASDQTHLYTLDNSQLTQIYKVELPESVSKSDRFVVTSKDGEALERCDSLSYFLKPPYFLSDEEQVYHNNLFLIDYDERLIYTRKCYEETPGNPYGQVDVEIYKEGADEPWSAKSPSLKPHKLWNFYDEFGLLLDTPRLKDELNEDYKERILDVFKNKSSSTKEGLLNGIARELGIRKNIVWSDTTKNLVIKDRMVVSNMITLNGEKLPLEKVWIDSDDYIFISANKEYPKDSIVSYVSGLEMHALNNRNDSDLYNQLFQPNGLATTLLLQYVRRIKDNIPVEWDSFKWNEGYWDANLPENGGVAFVPAMMDASISGFGNLSQVEKSNSNHYKR